MHLRLRLARTASSACPERASGWFAGAAVGLAAALLFSAACGGGGGGNVAQAAASPSSGVIPGGAATPTGTQPRAGSWLKGDLHIHTKHSADSGRFGDSIEEIVRMGEYKGLDFLVLTDHRQTTVLQDPQLTQTQTNLVVIAGMEWGGSGHAGASGLVRPPPYMTQTGATAAAQLQSIQDVIDDVHAQGGYFVLNHPLDPKNPFPWPAVDFDGMEVWNQLWSTRNTAELDPQQLQAWAQRRLFPQSGLQVPPAMLAAAQVHGGGANYQALKYWEGLLNQGLHLAAVGGGDRHYMFLPGRPTTLVHAATRTRAGVLEGIRKARTMVVRSPDAPLVELTADGNGDGIYEAQIGDSVALGQSIDVRIRVFGALGGKVDLIKDGQVVGHWDIQTPDFVVHYPDQPTQRSWYRVDVYEPLDMSIPNAQGLRMLVLGLTGPNSGVAGFLAGLGGWMQNVMGQVQDVVASGVPAALWLLINGQAMGVSFAPVSTTYPIVDWPDAVDRIMQLEIRDPDFCRSVITSPIWAE